MGSSSFPVCSFVDAKRTKPSIAGRALFFVLLVFFTCCLHGPAAHALSLPIEEVDALKQIAAKLKIPATLWNFDLDPCTQWSKEDRDPFVHNLACEISTTNTTANITSWHVVRIDVRGANLSGVLPEEFGKLRFLSWIDLSRNYINGSIPAAYWTFLPLQNLNLLVNRISGAIPEEIGSIKTLRSILLDDNMMQGSIPPSLGNLVELESLLLSCNNFSGELPETLGNLKNLTNVRIDGTEISGKIPNFIGNWTKLQRLDMQGTSMEGPFPPNLSLLQSLTELRVSDLKNSDGGFPSLEKMLLIQELVLRNCSISGKIPDYIGNLTRLSVIDLSFNNLTGEIPENIAHLSGLNKMYLTNNKLTGSIPSWIKRIGQNIDISYNTFTDLSSAPLNCEQGSRNYVASFSSTTNDLIHPCLRKGLPCNSTAKNHELFINCGGENLVVDGSEYERDALLDGTSNYYLSKSGKWAYSSTGNFIGLNTPFVAESASNSSLYSSARLSPLSLKYYGLCLQPGKYSVKLHFAEIVFTSGATLRSLGRRVFDVSIQGKWVLEDFNIAEAAGGIGREVVKEFTALVEDSALEIHFMWSGKGTNAIPERGVYGPLISAISVMPDFKPLVFESSKLSVRAISGIVVASTLAVVLVILGLLWFHFRKAIKSNDLRGMNLKTVAFRLKQIEVATRNFDPENKIGQGGFGPVYKGVLQDGSMIAVKQLSSKSNQGSREFVNEIGLISALNHPNLVKLHGCCIEGNQLLLIYEYMENNSLARALFGREGSKLDLDWSTRRKICIQVARGLAYLHEESRLKIVHRDIKATNVLLDKDLNAKISDFGLAKLDEEENTHISTRIAGTRGYMAPEYAMRGYLTDKADVYSFGIVTLEIVSGKSNTSYLPEANFMYLLDYAYVLQERRALLELVDPTLGNNFSSEEAEKMLNMALVCTDPLATLRPSMSSVVSMLEGDMPVPHSPPGVNVECSWTEASAVLRDGVMSSDRGE